MPDDAAIGWQHPYEKLAQLWSPATWSARPVPANPSGKELRQGHKGVQRRPDHIFLSVDRLAMHGKIYSQSSFDCITSKQLAKKETVSEQRHDGLVHKEGGSGQGGRTVATASSPGCSPLHANEEGRHRHYTGTGSTAFFQKTHKPNQAHLQTGQRSTPCRTCRELESRRRVPRFQDSMATSSGHCGHNAGGAARWVFLLFQTRVV